MFKEPGAFFKEIRNKEVNLVIPVVILLIIGILMSIMTFQHIPHVRKQWEQTAADLVYNIEYRVMAEKVKAVLYPVWVILFWAFFTIAFAVLTSSLGGWGEFKGFFNCTAFVIYPYAALQLIKFILHIFPSLMFIYWILLPLLAIWTCYILVKIAMNAGELDTMHSVIAAGIPAFFFLLLWLSYEPLIHLIVIPPAQT